MTFNLGIKKVLWTTIQTGVVFYLVELDMPFPNLMWVNSETGEMV